MLGVAGTVMLIESEHSRLGLSVWNKLVALNPSTAAGSGAAITYPEAAAVGKSRGKTTLNWVITWKSERLHKCIAAAGAVLSEFSLWSCFQARTRRGCLQNAPE